MDTHPQSSTTLREILGILTFQGGYNTNAVLAGVILLGTAAGVVGVFALLRRRSLVSDAIGHATLPGIALAFLVAILIGASERSLPILLLGAAATSALAVAAIAAILRYTRLREDAAIGIVLGVFFGVGVVLLSYVQHPANTSGASPAGLHHFIYGQTAAMRVGDAFLMATLAIISLAIILALLKELVITTFNSEHARVLGLPTSFLDATLLFLIVLVTVAGLQAVGLILVIALLIIPPVAARLWTDRLPVLIPAAGAIGALSAYAGAAASATLPRTPAGSVIVLAAGAMFLVSLMLAPRHGVLATTFRKATQRLRIAGEHLLEAAYEHSVSRRGITSFSNRSLQAMQRLWGWPFWMRPIVLASLRNKGYIQRTQQGYQLTGQGVARGARIARNHRLWDQYLRTHADAAPGHVDWSADMVEHVLSPEIIAELEAAILDAQAPVPKAPRA